MKEPVILVDAGVYALCNKNTGGVYVGASKDFLKRWKDHVIALGLKTHQCRALQKDWDTGHVFAFVLLEKCATAASLISAEEQWVEKFQLRYNTATHRVGWPGGKHTNEARQKISAHVKARKRNPKFIHNTKHTKASLELMSLRATGKRASAETRERLSRSLKGLKRSPETCERLAEVTRQRWKDPVYREAMCKKLKASNNDPCVKKKQSANSKRLWRLPGMREKLVAAFRAAWVLRRQRHGQ